MSCDDPIGASNNGEESGSSPVIHQDAIDMSFDEIGGEFSPIALCSEVDSTYVTSGLTDERAVGVQSDRVRLFSSNDVVSCYS